MKKQNRVLLNFLLLMGTAIALGILAGRVTAFGGHSLFEIVGIIMNKITFVSPMFIVFSALMVLGAYSRGKKSPDKAEKLLNLGVITAITAFSAVISGFCGVYSTADAVKVAVAVVLFFAVMAAAVCTERKYIKSELSCFTDKKSFVTGLLVLTGISAVYPVGPLPAVVLGGVWLAQTRK